MAERKPLVVIDGEVQEIPSGDTINDTIAPGTVNGNSNQMVQSVITGTSHTVTEADLSGNVIRKMNNAAAITVTVPEGLSNSQPSTFIQMGAGTVTFVAGTNVTINSADGNLSIAAQYGSASLIPDETNTDTYFLVGHLTS